MQYTTQAEETAEPVTPLFTVPEFQQRLLRFGGAGDERRDDERDEVLYVLEGSAVASVGGERRDSSRAPESSSRAARPGGSNRGGPEAPLRARRAAAPCVAGHAVIDGGERGTATAGREFTLFARRRTAARR